MWVTGSSVISVDQGKNWGLGMARLCCCRLNFFGDLADFEVCKGSGWLRCEDE